jgi:hypothetical protein
MAAQNNVAVSTLLYSMWCCYYKLIMFKAAVTFGDPLQKTQFANIDAAKTKVNCNAGDPVSSTIVLATTVA